MIALLLLAQYALGKDTSKDAYVIKQIDSCPDVGYYFKRDLNSNTIEPSCHLCFCQDNGTAVCWSREPRRCDEKQYYHAGKKKRDVRSRRSPGFSDIFFRDATRDVFNKQTPEQCKPFESSFSEGCPPADWCTGCTVCDCDANGRWDCHILSFCPDDKGKKQMKKRRGHLRNKIRKRQISTTKTIQKPTKKPAKKPPKKSNNIVKRKKSQLKQNKVKQINRKQKKNNQGKPKKFTQTKKPKGKYQKKNIPKGKSKFNKKSKKPITIKNNKKKDNKGKSTFKPGKLKNMNINKNDSTVKMAQTILKKVMASVEKIVIDSQKNINRTNKPKIIHKRSMSKNYKKGYQNDKNRVDNKIKSKITNKLNTKLWTKVSTKKANEKLINHSRKKREVITDDNENKTNISTAATSNLGDSNHYYKYTVDLKDNATATERSDTVINLDEVINKTDVSSLTSHIHINKTDNLSSILLNNCHNFTEEKFRKESNYNTSESSFRFNDTNHKLNITCGKICELKKFFRKLIGTRNTTTIKVKSKKFNILTNLKRIFRKTFMKNEQRSSVDSGVPFRKRNIVKALCKNIDSCKIDHTSKELQLKLDNLRAESFKILKSVKVIKGLLKLLDIHEGLNSTMKRNPIEDDMKKLNVIIKDEYDAKYGLVNLTETQRTQIKYIKENTLHFMQSMEKFAFILQDIMNVLKNGNDKVKHHKNHRCARNHNMSKINNSATVTDKFDKLKNLLINYNLVQNKFMKRMYDVLTTLESKANNQTHKNQPNKVSLVNDKSNYTIAIENYTKNIIKNLRKLKDLAEKLNSKNRRKRAVLGDDDAVEYLLMLMEYIFRQDKHQDVAPVNDGIDLLIEAIKNAPDIKVIKKKVLSNNLTKMKSIDEEINSRRNNEVTFENNDTYTFFDNKFKTFESIDEEHENLNKSVNTSSYETFHQDPLLNPIEVLSKEAKISDEISNNLDEKLLSMDKNKKRYEIFVDDADEEDAIDTTTVSIEPEISTTDYKVPSRTSAPDKEENNLANIYYEANDIKNKTELDWIEENYNNDRDDKPVQVETTTEANLVTRTIKIVTDKYTNPISSMSVEEDERRTKSRVEDNDSYKKQMNLLSSVEYGTEKSFSESESKEDKLNAESFPLFFA